MRVEGYGDGVEGMAWGKILEVADCFDCQPSITYEGLGRNPADDLLIVDLQLRLAAP